MTERVSTIFRPEAVRRYVEGKSEGEAAGAGPARPFAVIWAVVGALLGGWLVAGDGWATIGDVAGGIVAPAGGPSLGAVVALAGGLAAASAGVVLLNRLRQRGRLPVLLQMSSVECGAACLAMVLTYYGRVTRVSECADRLGIGRDGLTARAIAEGARAYGLDVRAFSLAPADLASLAGPTIVHWEFNHFLLVERWTPAWVDVVDPASGRRRLTAAEFAAGFTGVAIACEPGEGFARRAADAPAWRGHVRTFALQHPGLIGQILAASLLLQVLGLALPILSKVVVDDVLPHDDRNLLTVLALGFVVIVVSQSLLNYLRAMLVVALREQMDGRLAPMLLARLLALPYRFFEQRRSGDLIARIGSVSLIRDTLTAQVISTVLDGALAVGYLTLVLTQDLTIGGAVLALGLLQALLIAATGSAARDLTRRELWADAAAQSYLVEALTGIATLKASGTEERAHRHWSGLFRAQVAAGVQRGRHTAFVDAALAALRTLAPLVPLWLGASRVLDGRMSLGTMLATSALAAAALMPLSTLIGSIQRLQFVTAHLDRLADILLAAPEQDPDSARPAPSLTGRIDLDQVSFRYDPRSPFAVDEVSVAIAPGRKVAIVGRSGSGKSTLGKLLLGLYDPTEGAIRYDGHPAHELERRSLRRQFGVVLQEPVLFSGSIRENIAFNDPGVTLDRVIEAARLAEIHDEIERMPMGYETPLAEGGMGLSGGQRQRLALARALLHRPAILLLDEATSHLDVATEAAVEQHVSALACTRVVIAHRLSTVRDADLILVMDQGRIVERGPHEELVQMDGVYAGLAQQQGEPNRLAAVLERGIA